MKNFEPYEPAEIEILFLDNDVITASDDTDTEYIPGAAGIDIIDS